MQAPRNSLRAVSDERMASELGRWQWLVVLVALAACSTGGGPTRPRAASSGVASSAEPAAPAPAARETVDPFQFDAEFFSRKRPPQPGDWLAEHREQGQTFLQFEQSSTLRPSAERRTIVFQPLGKFSDEQRALLETLRQATELFFGLSVEIAKGEDLPSAGRRVRNGAQGLFPQYLTSTILSSLERHTPAHAIAYMGVTFEDLYPEPGWNFVFGEAELSAKVGVYSLKRFGPDFGGEPHSATAQRRLLRRSIQLLAHETGHVFGMQHCTAFECVMNGSNSLEESDRLPLEPCHECLHKLAFALKLQPLPRYLALSELYERHGLQDDARWLKERYARLSPSSSNSAARR